MDVNVNEELLSMNVGEVEVPKKDDEVTKEEDEVTKKEDKVINEEALVIQNENNSTDDIIGNTENVDSKTVVTIDRDLSVSEVEEEIENEVDVDLLEDSQENMKVSEDCSLAEEALENKENKDPLSLSMYESILNESSSSWRKVPENYSDEDEFDDEELTSESEDEADDSTSDKYCPHMRQAMKMQALKTRGPNGEVRITHIPAGIKITRVPETKEARLKREQELARRREEARNAEFDVGGVSEKRKHGQRMNLEDVGREDFDQTQDYLDFLQSKLKNISIKQCK